MAIVGREVSELEQHDLCQGIPWLLYLNGSGTKFVESICECGFGTHTLDEADSVVYCPGFLTGDVVCPADSCCTVVQNINNSERTHVYYVTYQGLMKGQLQPEPSRV
jgi:hypothetical protein